MGNEGGSHSEILYTSAVALERQGRIALFLPRAHRGLCISLEVSIRTRQFASPIGWRDEAGSDIAHDSLALKRKSKYVPHVELSSDQCFTLRSGGAALAQTVL